MNQPLRKEVQPDIETPVASQGIGPTLRGLREAKRLSPGEVSARLKFSGRQLEALETEQWDKLPGGMSLRGFVKNYGRFLDADVDALLTMLENQVGVAGPRPMPISTAHSLGPADMPGQAEAPQRPWGWLIIILILLFIAGFYAIERGWVPDSWLIFDWLKALKK